LADEVAVSIEIGSMGSSAQHDPAASAPGDLALALVVSFLPNSVSLLFPASSSYSGAADYVQRIC